MKGCSVVNYTYHVLLTGEQRDFEALQKTLLPGLGSVDERDGHKYLHSRAYEQLGSSAEVRRQAVLLIDAFNIGRELNSGVKSKITVAGVSRTLPDGREIAELELTPITARSSMFATCATMEEQTEAVRHVVELALREQSVRDTIRCFTRDRDRYDLRKVFELIRADVCARGGMQNLQDNQQLVSAKLCTFDEIDDFEEGVNNPAVSSLDDARHAAYQRPNKHRYANRLPQPMTLYQAQDFIEQLLQRWLAAKP